MAENKTDSFFTQEAKETMQELLDINTGGGGGGTSDYDDLTNKPSINGVPLSGNMNASDLGLAEVADIPDVSGLYTKPINGIPKSDLADDVKTSLGKADTALQSFTETDPTVPSWAKAENKPTYTAQEVGALPANTAIPSIDNTLTTQGAAADAKATGDAINEVDNKIQNYVVQLTFADQDETNGYTDKTVQEIVDAFNDGKRVILTGAIYHGNIDFCVPVESIFFDNTSEQYAIQAYITEIGDNNGDRLVTFVMSWDSGSGNLFMLNRSEFNAYDIVYDANNEISVGDAIDVLNSTTVKSVNNQTPDNDGNVDVAVDQTLVDNWLDEHPEATTTVQDGSITYSKLNSEVSGDISGLKNAVGNDNLLWLMNPPATPRTASGVTYTYDDTTDTFTVNGTSTAAGAYPFLSTSVDVPSYIKPGSSYYLKYNTSDAKVYFSCLYLVNDTWQYINYTKDTVFTIPSNATNIGFRLNVASGDTVTNATVKVSMQSLSFDDITQNMDLFKLCGQYPYSVSSQYGITYTYSVNNDAFTVNGTSTAQSTYRILGTADDVPFFIKSGESYHLRYSTTDTNIACQYMYLVGSTWNYIRYYTDTIITIPYDATDFGFRLIVPSGSTISNATVKVSLHLVSETKIVSEEIISNTVESNNIIYGNVFELYTDFEKNSGWWLSDGTNDGGANHKHTQKLAIRPNTTYYTGYIIDGYDCYGMFYDYYGNQLSPLTSAMITEHQYMLPDGTGTMARSSYSPMFKFTSPVNAYYISFNFSILKNAYYDYTYRSYLASKPIFATNLYGDLVIKANDPVWNKFHKRKLCVIGTSQIMIDRLSRTGKFDGPNSDDDTQYISGVQEYLMPWYDTVDSYGYSSAAMMYKSGETVKSIYTRVVTDQLDLSGYDDYFVTHSSTDLTANNIGDITSYSDLGNNETFIGALRQIIDYIYTQNPKANVFVQTRIIRAAFNTSSYYQNTIAANEKVRKLAKLLGLTCVDTAEESGFNYYVAPYWCYDNNGHPNQLGNYNIGLAMRKTIIGI